MLFENLFSKSTIDSENANFVRGKLSQNRNRQKIGAFNSWGWSKMQQIHNQFQFNSEFPLKKAK